MAPPSMIEETVESADGTKLAVYKWTPENVKAQVIIVHGYLEHGQRYKEVAEHLSDKEIAVVVYDIRGHGKSSGGRGLVKQWNEYIQDLDAILEQTTNGDDSPVFVLGHSNGGLITLSYYMHHTDNNRKDFPKNTIKGLIISSPWLGPADKLPWIKIQASKILGSWLPTLTLPVNEDEVSGKVLTHDETLAKEHDDDERNLNKLTVGWAFQSMSAQKNVTENCKHISLPLLFAYASDDKVADAELNKKFVQMLSCDDKTIEERKGAYHEILNETDRQELYQLIIDWILKHV